MTALRAIPGAPCAAALFLVLALLALTGCGGGSETTVTETVTEREAPADDGSAGGEQRGDGGAGAPDGPAALESFQSPSGNIGCVMLEGFARCDVGKHSWAAPRPDDCPPESDAGQGLEVGATGEAGVVCAGDTARDRDAPVLAYGTASEVGGTVCVSRRSGITCTNGDGHGFTVSAESYELF